MSTSSSAKAIPESTDGETHSALVVEEVQSHSAEYGHRKGWHQGSNYTRVIKTKGKPHAPAWLAVPTFRLVKKSRPEPRRIKPLAMGSWHSSNSPEFKLELGEQRTWGKRPSLPTILGQVLDAWSSGLKSGYLREPPGG